MINKLLVLCRYGQGRNIHFGFNASLRVSGNVNKLERLFLTNRAVPFYALYSFSKTDGKYIIKVDLQTFFRFFNRLFSDKNIILFDYRFYTRLLNEYFMNEVNSQNNRGHRHNDAYSGRW